LSRAVLADSPAVTITPVGVERVSFDADIDELGSLGHRAWGQGLDALGRLLHLVRAARIRNVVAVAPHALGGAANAEGFLRAAQRRFGIDVALPSPEATARLAHRGARRALMPIEAFGVVHLTDASIDVAAGQGTTCEITDSLPLGVARMQRACGAPETGLARSDCEALLGLLRLSGGPVAKKLREYGAPVVMASSYAGRVLEVARAWGYVDPQSPTIGRLALHALVQEIVQAVPDALIDLGVEPWRAGLLGTAALAIDAIAGLLGQREVWLMREGLTEGVALEILESRGLRLVRAANAAVGYLPVTVA
jgi:exopolyphosphatase/pppGpp-phosphohydrolase